MAKLSLQKGLAALKGAPASFKPLSDFFPCELAPRSCTAAQPRAFGPPPSTSLGLLPRCWDSAHAGPGMPPYAQPSYALDIGLRSSVLWETKSVSEVPQEPLRHAHTQRADPLRHCVVGVEAPCHPQRATRATYLSYPHQPRLHPRGGQLSNPAPPLRLEPQEAASNPQEYISLPSSKPVLQTLTHSTLGRPEVADQSAADMGSGCRPSPGSWMKHGGTTAASSPALPHACPARTPTGLKRTAASAGCSRAYHAGASPSRGLSIVTSTTNGRKAFLVDTLAVVRRLEAEGLTQKQAETITLLIMEVLHESLDSAGHTFVSKAEMQKSEMMADAALARLRTELQSSYDIKHAGIQREVEGLRTDLDKVKSEIRYEVDKVTAGQRLDLNLERGRVKEELNLHAQETSNLTNKVDREVNSLKAQLEAAKFDVIRYCVGTLVSVSAVGLGMLRILM